MVEEHAAFKSNVALDVGIQDILIQLRKGSRAVKPKIAVVCAYNPKNAGMYSVDLAAKRLFGDKDCHFDLFVTQTGLRRGARHFPLLKPYWPIQKKLNLVELNSLFSIAKSNSETILISSIGVIS